jgi:hypothetical protein
MTAAGVVVTVASWLSSQQLSGGVENGGWLWTVLAIVAAGALVWILVWSRMRPLFLRRARPLHHFRRARQKELKPR